MATMTRSQFRKQLQEGLNAVFGLTYKKHPQEWTEIFESKTSKKAFEEQVLMSGLGAAPGKAEGAAIAYDSGSEAWVQRYSHETIALAFSITQEAQEDGLYGDIGSQFSKSLANSMQYTKEVRGATILNDGFTTTIGDGLALFSTVHPLTGGGTFQNRLTTAADISEATLEEFWQQINGFVDERGIPKLVTIKKIIVPRQIWHETYRITHSTLRVGTANNDPNALKDLGNLGVGAKLNHYLSDPDAFFAITNCDLGFQHFKRKGISRGIEGDFETGNMRYKARERYVFGVTDPRCGFASPGADT